MFEVFISDCHIGASFSQECLLRSFLEENRHLITTLHLVGDIFDFWKRPPNISDLSIFNKINNIKYYPGNHDAESIIARLFTSNVVHNAVYRKNKKNIYVSHGNEFDSRYGGISFFDYFLDRTIQYISKILGFYLRSKLRFISDFYYQKSNYFDNAEIFLRGHMVDYYIYGHTHMPGIIRRGDITFINLGSWYDAPMALFCNEEKYALVEINGSHLSPSEEDFNGTW